MSAIELLPCPFCGGEAKLIEGEECAYVQCLQVKCHRGPFVDGDNAAADEAVDEWNRRTDLSQASVAAALGAAAAKLQNVADNWDCGHNESRLCDCAPYVEQWGLAADEIRALITPAQHDALAAHVAAEVAKARAEDAATVLRYRPTGENAKHFVDVLVCDIANEILTGKKAK